MRPETLLFVQGETNKLALDMFASGAALASKKIHVGNTVFTVALALDDEATALHEYVKERNAAP